MNNLTKDFFKNSSIPKNEDTIKIMDFLSHPDSVNQMIAASKMGLPALAGVVKELEDNFADCHLFPLNHSGQNSNAPNRRNIGWMIRFVMKAYGYTPIASGLPNSNDTLERTRVGKFSKYFETAAIYSKTIQHPNHTIIINSI